jgi:ADP-ribose pyrophosphatase YjhB (NUDIX family)
MKVSSFVLHSRFGMLTYGLRPEGYDAWVFHETGGGGAITIPYAISPDGVLYIGLIQETRANMGEEPVWCVIGGFVKPEEKHEEARDRETSEEAGLDATEARELPGMAGNPNRAFFVTDCTKNEGVKAYALKIPYNLLEPVGDGRLNLKAEAIIPGLKKPQDVGFFHWVTATVISPDMFAHSAILRLVADEFQLVKM